MTRTEDDLAVVGSPSTNAHISLDLLNAATQQPLVGAMLYVEQEMADGTELGLGTVTEVTTNNKWHSDPVLRGIIKEKGEIPGMTGVVGDTRAASVSLQACYKKFTGNPNWAQAGPTFRMSPSTGAPVRRLTNELVDELIAGTEHLHHLGLLHGTDVRAPLNIRDFSGSRGAFHTGVFGQSGSGKTALSAYLLGSQMRHPDLGMIIIDPQGQWSTEQDLPFSLQGWAKELGREVVVRRVSEDLRLDKDANLFGELLSKTKFLKELMKMSTETQDLLTDEMVKALRAIPMWEEMDSETLLDTLVDAMRQPHVLRNVYADVTRKERLLLALSEVIGTAPTQTAEGEPAFPENYVLAPPEVLAERRRAVLGQFQPLHNLFSKTNPSGARRHSLWGTIQSVFERPEGVPAPLVVLDMSTAAGVSWLDEALAGEERAEAMAALRILDQDTIKAAILRRTCVTLKNASEDAFRGGKNLNTMVVFDEAWRYAPSPQNASEDEIKELSKDLAGYARDTRKFGIGWFYITQTPRSLNNDIWDQLSIRVIGYGLSGAELSKVGETLDGPEHLSLYRAFAPPDATNPRVYPFMLTGPVSPLSFTKAPLFVSAPTNFEDFRHDNRDWIEPIRLALGLQVVSGTPKKPSSGSSAPVARRAPATTGAPTKRAQEDAQRVREHAKTGGVDPRSGAGLSTDKTFSDSLSAIDDDTEPPF